MENLENRILPGLDDLHLAFYNKMASISGIAGLTFLGFESSRTNPVLPEIAMKSIFSSMTPDRNRPTPQIGAPIMEVSGIERTLEIGNETFTGPEAYVAHYPLPVLIYYQIATWCYDAQTQLLMDEAILQTFPDRGILNLEIGGEPTAFPIELMDIQPLDDLTENLRQKIYRFKIEAWIKSHMPSQELKTILGADFEIYKGEPEDINLPGGDRPLEIASIKESEE